MYKGIIFDFFGVIHTDEYIAWLNRHGYERTGEFFEASRLVDSDLITMSEFFERLSRLSGFPAAKIQHEFEHKATFNEELIGYINFLHGRYKTGLISNSNGSHLREIFKQQDIESSFDSVVISGEVGYTKPDKEIFEYALDLMSLKPEQTVFIDDNKDFVEAASQLGLKGLWYQDNSKLLSELGKLGFWLKI